MMGLLCVGAGGALGAMGRYGLGLIPLGSELPLMTLLINFLGSVAIGAIVETSELAAGALSREAVLFLKVGLCGGFTTFSTFSLETLELIEGGQYAIAGAYALVSVVPVDSFHFHQVNNTGEMFFSNYFVITGEKHAFFR